MARQNVNTVTTFGNESRINDNFIELYSGTFSASANFSATCSAGTLIATGEVRGASANFTATCSASSFHATGGIIAGGAISGAAISGSSANFTATCSAGSFVGATLNGAVVDNLAWTGYTPTITAGSGSFTTVSAAGRYKQIGKTVHVSVNVTVTTAGTATGNFKFTLPVNASTTVLGGFAGREYATNGSTVAGTLADATHVTVQFYNATFAPTDGMGFSLSGTYEAA